jgi:hypothetical protein
MKIALKRTVAPSGSRSSGIRGWNAQRILKYDKLSFFIKLLCVGLCMYNRTGAKASKIFTK